MLKNICVVMSTYNGEKYIKQQIDSILAQEGVLINIFIRDDGSTDKTIDIIKNFHNENITIVKGKNVGAKDSFLFALENAPEADYYAFSDQDDVWEKEKLSVAVNALEKHSSSMPGIYCGAVMPVDSSLNPLAEGDICKKYKPYLCKYPFLHGAITISAGCTIVFNRKLKQIISQYHPKSFIMHDSWIQQVCLAIGGFVIKDSSPYIKYRQHENNVVGGKRGFLKSVLRRIKFNLNVKKNCRSRMYAEILSEFGKIMSDVNKSRCKIVCDYKKSLKTRLCLLKFKDFWKGKKIKIIEKFFLFLFGLY